jgi:hypothetical protein
MEAAMTSTGNPKRIENAKSFFIGLSKGNLIAALAAFSDDATYRGAQMVAGKIERRLLGSKAEIATYMGEWLEKASGGITYHIRSAKEWGDCVLIEWSAKATGQAGSYENEGIQIFEFNDQDQINHSRPYSGRAALMKWGLPR